MVIDSRDHHPRVAFARARLSASWKPADYPKELKDLTDQKRRLDLGLQWKEVAEQIGVDSTTVTNWTKRWTKPAFQFWPDIIRFLGYDPRPEASTLGAEASSRRAGHSREPLPRCSK